MTSMTEETVDARPQAGAAAGYRVPRGTKFPEVCVKCGRPEGVATRRRRFSYVSPTLYVAFTFGCVGMILGAVLYIVTRRTMTFGIPTCSTCSQGWERASRWPVIYFVGSLLTTVVASFVWKVDLDRLWLPVVGVAATVFGTMAIHSIGRKHQLWATGIEEKYATLAGIHPAVVDVLQASADLNGAARRVSGPHA